MRLYTASALLMLLAAAFTDAGRSSRSSSYRSSRYSYSSYRSSSYTYRGPVYTRRITPSLMGALYFSYVTRYPSYFSYRRTALGATGGNTCVNYLALDNGSYIGTFSCPFLPDEPSDWTRCCGYDDEGFCCDPAYDDSWKYGRGLSALVIVMIVSGCLLGAGILGLAIFSGVRKRALASRTGCEATGAVAATVTGGAQLQQQQPCAATAQAAGRPLEVKQPLDASQAQQPPPYPVASFEQGPASTPTVGATVNPGFEPAPYPLYPPPYYGGHGGGTAATH